jgi:hypothetical protein
VLFGRSAGKLLLQHARALANGQSDPWAMFDRLGKDVPRLVEIVARIEQAINLRAVARPFLDLVEIAIIRVERVVLLIRPIAHVLDFCTGSPIPKTRVFRATYRTLRMPSRSGPHPDPQRCPLVRFAPSRPTPQGEPAAGFWGIPGCAGRSVGQVIPRTPVQGRSGPEHGRRPWVRFPVIQPP